MCCSNQQAFHRIGPARPCSSRIPLPIFDLAPSPELSIFGLPFLLPFLAFLSERVFILSLLYHVMLVRGASSSGPALLSLRALFMCLLSTWHCSSGCHRTHCTPLFCGHLSFAELAVRVQLDVCFFELDTCYDRVC